ncbi:MAG: Thg1-like protein 1 [Hyperionvirus sp.]|uniref:Thg1-like protein 1 n=1 Tax=Hyperionvirus sp. TaxID=2487770 RepID=A0A3G5A9E6_9VIRU|nr:MAG: Thg1-like protein 1 [Hyperionvirus sp.]
MAATAAEPELPSLTAKYETEKHLIIQTFLEMAQCHLTHFDEVLSFEYNSAMAKLYEKVANHTLKANELFHQIKSEDKNRKDELIALLEDLPRKLGGYNVPLTLDLMFRADGHTFSKLFSFFKKIDLQPFSLAITQAFIALVFRFGLTNEFSGMETFYLCSDEITGLSKHGVMTEREQLGAHPFGGKRDKITSMIAATLSANFTPALEIATDEKLVKEIAQQRKSYPTFDARVFPTNQLLVGKMFKSRIQSCYRNTVSEFHDYFFGTKAGHNLNSTIKLKRMLEIHKFDFELMCPPCLKYGVFIKGQKAIVPLKKPFVNDKFIEFLYAKDDFKCPFEFVFFEDMLKAYPHGHYISESLRNEKKVKFEADAKLQHERDQLKADKVAEYPRPSKEEVIRLRQLKKKQKEDAREARAGKIG